MNMFGKALAAALVATSMLVSAPMAVAKSPFDFDPERISDKDEFPFDASKAYLLVESDNMINVSFMKLPNDEELATWEALRLEEFEDEKKKYVGRVKRYERRLETWKKTRRGHKPEAPVEPTEGSFSITPFELSHNLAIGPQGRFNNKGGSLYLYEVPAGEYVFYGNVFFNPNGGAMGTCVCMGTVALNVEAGKVSAVRVRLPFMEMYSSMDKDERPKTVMDIPEDMTSQGLVPVELALTDTRLPQDKMVFPETRLIDRLPNWFGVEIDRLMPIEGRFTYDGDTMVDLLVQEPAEDEAAGGDAAGTAQSDPAMADSTPEAATDAPVGDLPNEDESEAEAGAELAETETAE